MAKKKKLSNPFSTGGGGALFEAHVQASFVTLMLTGGHAPCLPCWPIKEIKLQGKIDGFETDDLVVIVEDPINKKQRKILGQVKHSIAITPRNPLFGEVIQGAWNDYNNPKSFTRGEDIIALITGPLSATDSHNVQWLLNQARHTKNVDEFFRNVHQSNFSPSKSIEKLEVFQHHLKAANRGFQISRDELYDFLRHFHLIGYDLGNEFGVVLSLLHSHISQFQQQSPQLVWSKVVEIVQIWNKDAGTITATNIPEDLLEAFKQKTLSEIPEEFKVAQESHKENWAQHPDATYLALAILIGAWDENNQSDIEAITQILGISYEEWLKKAREILLSTESPLSLRNGIWKVIDRAKLWNLLATRILDQNLDMFKSLSVSVLKEPDPAFELSPDKRYAANIHGKMLNYSNVLRKGISEGLAILNNHPEACRNCSHGKAERTCRVVLHEILSNADWVMWGSLNGLLPTLAEASPDEFLTAVEKAIYLETCPFDELFSQEGTGITGRNYLTGLLWALEVLAWDEQYLVRVCVALAELSSHDPGGNWANRPSNSLITILLPWLPQTLAPVEKRKVALRTILREQPDIAWDLIIKLLPGHCKTSLGSHKPNWRNTIPDDWKNVVSQQEYWSQVNFISELAVANAGIDVIRLSTLIERFDKLPKRAFDQLVKVLSSESIGELSENQTLLLWDHLTKFTNRHKRFSDSSWALPIDLIHQIEKISEKLSPTDPFNLYQHLFTDREFDLYDENGDWVDQGKKLNERREIAISKIFNQHGIDGVIRFLKSVSSPFQVGYAIGAIEDETLENTILPHFLDSTEDKLNAFVSNFIWRRYQSKGSSWCDGLKKSDWKPRQLGLFLACLPFTKEVWNRASEWLKEHEAEYWTRTGANIHQSDGDISNGIEKLIQYGRPQTAINCMSIMLHLKWPIDSKLGIKALLEAISSKEPGVARDEYNIINLIIHLQKESQVNSDNLLKVEWAYLPLLDGHGGATPKLLENRLANDPVFFCQIIQMVYRSKKEDQPPKEPNKKLQENAINGWQLLHMWKTPPGTQQDGVFNEIYFTNWFEKVKEICKESGHLDVAQIHVGEVLINTPPDPDGLWIHKAVAASLNELGAEDMRAGFKTGIFNARGAHWVDPTGKQDRDLAKQYQKKAEEIEDAGFHRFAVILKSLSTEYNQQADQEIEDQKLRNKQ
ncbi:hypothetical protein MM213_01215 [Belliella sp. R4-6]|uniref:Uncharacterized protein n=1 Tax=Belliella alkalica TaxID=1730871 RepID=A0ABS9V6P1_9BACT|nr:hypothetical protein [Belliella alkalica]MCH7412086.1 hypothetical protein [Belliella alkalica]